MKLLRLKVDGFGGVRGEFTFDPERVTVVVDDNEAGKSTIIAAIAAALYGLDTDRRSHRVITPQERWRPWSGGNYRVELELESAGERYTVKRDFERGTVEVWNARGQEVTADFREGKEDFPVGKKLVGVDGMEFEKCSLVRQGDLDQVVPGDEKARRSSTLHARLESAADTHIGDTNASEATKVLDEALRRYTCAELNSTVTVDYAIQSLETKRAMVETDLKSLEHDLTQIAGPLDELARIGDEERQAKDNLGRLDSERRESLAGEVRRQLKENDERRAELDRLRAESELLKPAAHLPANSEAELRETVARFEEARRNLETLETRRREEVARDRASLDGELEQLRNLASCTPEDADACVALAAEMRRAVNEDGRVRTDVFNLRDQLASKGYDPERIQEMTALFSGLGDGEQRLLRRQAEMALSYQTEVANLEQERTASTETLRSIDAERNHRRLPGVVLLALGLGGAAAGGAMVAMRGPVAMAGTLLVAGGLALGAGTVLLMVGGRARAADRDQALRGLSEAQRRLNQLKAQRAETEVGLAELCRTMGFRDTVELMREWHEYSRMSDDSGPLMRAQEQIAQLEKRKRETVESARALLAKAGSDSPFPEELERVATSIRRMVAAKQRLSELERNWSWIDEEKRVAEAAATGLKERAVRILQSAGLAYDPARSWNDHVQELNERLRGRSRYTLLVDELIPQARKRLLSETEVAEKERQIRLVESDRAPAESASDKSGRAQLEIEAEARRQREVIEVLQRKRDDLRASVDRVWHKYQTEHPEKLGQRAVLDRALARARRFKQAAELARETIQKVAVETHRRWAEHLNYRVAELLRSFGTHVEHLRFGDDLDFSIKFADGVQATRGRAHLMLSSGARDQLYLAIRLAISEYLSRREAPLPLLLDDCFATSDDERARAGMKLLLEHFARGHQVILMTCHRKRHEIFAQLDPDLYAARVRWLDVRAATASR